MPITFNSQGGFLNGTISSSNGDIFITTSGSVGAINIGNQTLSGSQVIEKDSTGKVRNKKIFNADGTITQQKFDQNEKITETKVKDPGKGRELVQSASATSNQIEFQQNDGGALIIASGSNPGFVAFMNDVGDRSMRARGDVFLSGSKFCSTGVAMNGSSLDYYIQQQHLGALGSTQTFGDSNGTGFLMVSQSGDTRVSNNLIVDDGISVTTQNTGSADFPGAIVGYNVQGLNVTHASYNLTTTMAVPDAGLNVCFVAPKSGIVEIEVQVLADGGSSGVADLTLGLSDSDTYNAVQTYYEQLVLGFPRFDHMNVVHKWVVPSLTPGTTYKYWLGAKSSNTTGTPTLNWGGSASGRFTDFIMKATALPSNTEIET